MKISGSVIKASSTYYWYINQPDQLYQIAEEFYQKAQEYQKGHSVQRAEVYYQKAEECYRRVRDVYRSKILADEAKRQADEAKRQADEAKEQTGEVCNPEKTPLGGFESQPYAKYQSNSDSTIAYRQPLMRQQRSEPQPPAPGPGPAAASVRKTRPIQENKAAPKNAVKQSESRTVELMPQQPEVTRDSPDISEEKAHRPISWKGKKYS